MTSLACTEQRTYDKDARADHSDITRHVGQAWHEGDPHTRSERRAAVKRLIVSNVFPYGRQKVGKTGRTGSFNTVKGRIRRRPAS